MKIIKLLGDFVIMIDEEENSVYLVNLDAVFDTVGMSNSSIATRLVYENAEINDIVHRNSIVGFKILKTLKADYLQKL